MHTEPPASFQPVFDYLASLDYGLASHDWTDRKLRRHYHAKLRRDGRWYHVKLKDHTRDDPDDYHPEGGFDRMLWGCTIVQRLRQQNDFSVDTPAIIRAPRLINFGQHALTNAAPRVSWVVTEFNTLGPLIPYLPNPEDTYSTNWDSFRRGCHVMAATWKALCTIRPETVGQLGLPLLPRYPPYQSLDLMGARLILGKHLLGCRRLFNGALQVLTRRAARSLSSHPAPDLCLGLDAFERKNFFLPRYESTITQLVDTETWYWYSPYTMIAKLFIRLWVNEDRPDLAATFLRVLFDNHINPDPATQRQADQELVSALRRKIISGRRFDHIRRGQRDPTNPVNVRRRQLSELMAAGTLAPILQAEPATFYHV